MSVRAINKVYFTEPIISTIEPEKPVSTRNLTPTYFEITGIVDACEADGFTKCSIVVRRSTLKWSGVNSETWGIITSLKRYRGLEEYAPISVRWFDPLKGDTMEWPEDLWLISKAEETEIIHERIKAQDDFIP